MRYSTHLLTRYRQLSRAQCSIIFTNFYKFTANLRHFVDALWRQYPCAVKRSPLRYMCQAIGFDQGRDAKDSALGHLHDEQQSSKLLPLVAPPSQVLRETSPIKPGRQCFSPKGLRLCVHPSICRDANEPYLRCVSCAYQMT